jgi:hypothetical protein
LALLDQHPPAQNHRMRGKEGDDLLCGQGQVRFGHVRCPPHFTAQLMQRCRPTEGAGLTERVGDLVGDRDSLLAAAQRLVGIAEMPEDAPEERARVGTAVEPVAEGRLAAPSRIVNGDRSLEMAPRSR